MGIIGYVKFVMMYHRNFKNMKKSKTRSESIKKLHSENKLKKINDIYHGPNGFLGKTHTDASKEKIAANNAMLLPEEVTAKRIKDYNQIEKSFGWVTELARDWGVSHTQVRRFIKKNIEKN